MFKIIQTWWHIENKTHPSNSIVFREVTDLYTDQQFVYYRITDFFVKLKIKSRYKNYELTFIQRKDLIQINLGDLKTDWPSANMGDGNIRHVKVEIQYTDINPRFELNRLRLGYNSTYTVDGVTQPEFSITNPLGMKLRNKGKDIKLLLKKIDEDDIALYHEGVNVNHEDGKISYNVLIRDDSYKEITSIPTNENTKVEIKVRYSVTNQFKFWFFPILPVLLLSFGILEYFFQPVELNSNEEIVISLTYVIIFITFLTFYLTFMKEGYEIPWNKFLIIFTPISAILLIIPQAIPYIISILPQIIHSHI